MTTGHMDNDTGGSAAKSSSEPSKRVKSRMADRSSRSSSAMEDEIEVGESSYPGDILSQDSADRREIRVRYRSLLNDVSSNRTELLAGNTVVLKEKIDITNQIFDNVKHPREAALDAQCCSSIANLGKQKAQALTTGFGGFSLTEFVEKLFTRLEVRAIYGEDGNVTAITRERWERLGEATQTFFRRSPTIHFVDGLLNRESKARMKTPRPEKSEEEKRENMKPAVKPKLLDSRGNPEREEVTTREVETALRILKATYRQNGRIPICYFEFVTNPESFSQTIENVFYASFLVKDGYARIFLDEDNLPVIEPVEGPVNPRDQNDSDDDDDEDSDCHQKVIAWTVDDWKNIIRSFNINQSLIPTRPPVTQRYQSSSASASQELLPYVNGAVSSSERSRSTVQAAHSPGKSASTSSFGPPTKLKSARGLSNKSASHSANDSLVSKQSPPTPGHTLRRIYNEDSEDDEDDELPGVSNGGRR